MARLVESSQWVFFDVVARGAETGAAVAMALRERLPGARIHSAPDRERSSDELLPHLLHCRAASAGATASQTRVALDAAMRDLDLLATSRARVVFRDEVAQAAGVAA